MSRGPNTRPGVLLPRRALPQVVLDMGAGGASFSPLVGWLHQGGIFY